jgi:hypothetical protein
VDASNGGRRPISRTVSKMCAENVIMQLYLQVIITECIEISNCVP